MSYTSLDPKQQITPVERPTAHILSYPSQDVQLQGHNTLRVHDHHCAIKHIEMSVCSNFTILFLSLSIYGRKIPMPGCLRRSKLCSGLCVFGPLN